MKEDIKYPNTEKLTKDERELINDLCPNEKYNFDIWFDDLKDKYLHVIGYIDLKYWYDVFMSGVDTDEAATMIKTPCIMKFKDDYLLYFDSMKHINLTTMEVRVSAIESCDANVTNQYLANTYGKVESKEHAEFIVKLAENHDVEIISEWQKGCWFNFFLNSQDKLTLNFSPKSTACDNGEKKITIQLPPKEVKEMKNNGDNLVLGCEESKCKEWPCVNDEVLTSDGNGVVRLLPDSKGYYVVSVNGEYYQYQIDELSKPKTPAEELRELLHLLWDENCGDFDDFVDIAIRHVTKKPQ